MAAVQVTELDSVRDGFMINYNNTVTELNSHTADTDNIHGCTGFVVGTGGTQTLEQKTLILPAIADFSNATHNHSNNAGGGGLSVTDFTNSGHNHSNAAGGGGLSVTDFTNSGHNHSNAAGGGGLSVTDFTNMPHNHSNAAGGGSSLDSPTITTPTITTPVVATGQWVNANHDHSNVANGGAVSVAGVDHDGILNNGGIGSHAAITSHMSADADTHGLTGASNTIVGRTTTESLAGKTLSYAHITGNLYLDTDVRFIYNGISIGNIARGTHVLNADGSIHSTTDIEADADISAGGVLTGNSIVSSTIITHTDEIRSNNFYTAKSYVSGATATYYQGTISGTGSYTIRFLIEKSLNTAYVALKFNADDNRNYSFNNHVHGVSAGVAFENQDSNIASRGITIATSDDFNSEFVEGILEVQYREDSTYTVSVKGQVSTTPTDPAIAVAPAVTTTWSCADVGGIYHQAVAAVTSFRLYPSAGTIDYKIWITKNY